MRRGGIEAHGIKLRRRPSRPRTPGPLSPPLRFPPMSYTVLARRYRSQSFDELVGQESIAKTLRNAVEQDRLAHAYLFVGTRGVGKTSTARIFAKAINAPNDEPKDVADAIMAGRDIDVIEIDAASNNSVDDARELIARCVYRPMRGRKKVYNHRRSPHALDRGIQRPPQDHGGAPRARRVHPLHHRDPQGPRHHPEPVPAIRFPQHPHPQDRRAPRPGRHRREADGDPGPPAHGGPPGQRLDA